VGSSVLNPVRHVFLIHSSITYLVARQVIRYLRLTPDVCAYVLLRRIQPDDDDPVSAQLHLYDNITVPLTWRIGQVWGRIATLDRQVADLTSRADYALYVPHLDHPMARLLYTNRQCKAINYLEEGTESYIPAERLRHTYGFRDRVVRYLFSLGRYPALDHFSGTHGAAYCINDACFPSLARKVILPIPFRSITVNPDPSNQIILVFDAFIEFNLVGADAFRQALHELFAWLITQNRHRILYKYHPIQIQQPERRAYYEREVFGPWKDRLTFTEITANVSLENIAFSYPSVEYAIIGSSVGLYARFCGRKVISVAKRLAELDARFHARMQLMPPVFFEAIEFL
jgi:hypothetical protein